MGTATTLTQPETSARLEGEGKGSTEGGGEGGRGSRWGVVDGGGGGG